MSANNPCGDGEVNWNVGDQEVIGSVCVFDDEITISFSAEGKVATPYDEGDTAFNISLGMEGQPFRSAMSSIRDAVPTGVSLNIPSAQDLIPSELSSGSFAVEVKSTGSDYPTDDFPEDPVSGDIGSFPSLSDINPFDGIEEDALNFSYSAAYTDSVRFNRITIPTIMGEDKIREKLPDSVTVEATVNPGNAIDKLLFGPKTMRMDIPADAFVDIKTVDFSCASQHSELFSAAEDIKEDGDEFISDVRNISLPSRSRVDSIQEARDDIRERIREFGGEKTLRDIFDNDQTAIERLREGRLTDFDSVEEAQDELDNIREDLQSVVQDLNRIRVEHSLGGLKRDISTVRNRRGNVGSLCRDEFEDLAGGMDLEGVEEALDDYSEMRDQVENLQFLVDNLPPEISVPEAPEVDDGTDVGDEVGDVVDDVKEKLEEIPDKIRERVDSLRSKAEVIRSTPFIDRDPEKLEELREEAEELIDDIEELESGRPGRSEALGETRGILGDLNRINAASQSSLPCSSRFPDAEDLVTEFEEETGNITTDVTEDRLETLTSVEEAAVSAIQNVDNESCREQFRRRMRRANRDVDIKVSPVRVAQELVDQNEERRANLLAQLGISTNIENIGNN